MDVVIPRRRRRTHSEVFKQSAISACSAPGVSVAGMALANGLNANQVRRWLRERCIEPPSRRGREAVSLAPTAEPRFVPVALAPPAEPRPAIRLDMQRGAARIELEWPTEAADACGAWLRQWLA